MKIIFRIFFIVAFISCNQESSTKNIFPVLKVTDNNDILDSWAMCSTSGNGQMIQKNVCPIITFTANGTGYVQFNSLIAETFTWKLDKVHMKITYKSSDTHSTFPDTNYYAEFRKEKDIMKLSLRHNDKNYYLSKFLNSR
ncbi:MAG: hypothetical protein QM737_00860 [Ferruginibacter sp.]